MNETLLVVWQNIDTRQKYHIGTLTFKPQHNIYEFQYNFDSKHRGVEEALDSGFTGIHEFELSKEIFKSEDLFYFFSKRLPNPNRSDYNLLLERFGLDESSSKLEFLKRTKGRLATDEYELFAPIITEDSTFSLNTYIESWQYYDGELVLGELNVDERLILIREPENEYDQYAVKIHTKAGYKLGYISAVYSQFLANVIDNDYCYEVRISNIYPNAIPQMKVWIEIKGEFTFQYLENEKKNKELILC